MTENVILTVRGHQTDLGEDATTELIAGAAYYYRNGKHYILYDEIDPESGEQSGNTIKIGEDRVDVIRRGAGKVHMVFEKEKQISSQYHTPAGVIQMEIFTSRLRTIFTDCIMSEMTHGNKSLYRNYTISFSVFELFIAN